MSQEIILEILISMGGNAKTGEIAQRARELYPDLTLWQYTHNRLGKLKKRGLVDFKQERFKRR
ncbi:MAG TPA: hypothetical protein VE566_02605 [Nitrososphaeraceae archaeon]|jgi:hypothetical protein|nr:hypothetical protein [Nitrososphaeraceae archaeon]